MILGASLRERREAVGLTLRALARRVEIDPSYLSRVEQGAVPPSEQLLRALAPHLDLGLDEILLLAGRLPESLQHLVALEPERVTAALTGLAAMCVAEPRSPYGGPVLSGRGRRAIEDGFPFAELSAVAEIESWRKEVYRPIYHLHKWWAQRLGSVFRAVILGATMPQGSAVMDLFYQPVRLPAPVVFDPFMGSGTTVGEAHKLGCTVIGRDINPVAHRAVRVALAPMSRDRLLTLFARLEATAGGKLRDLYRATDGDGEPCDVLYYFWVKTLPCPDCATRIDLFSSYIIGRHAYVRRNPRVQILCPECGEVFAGRHPDEEVGCPGCGHRFDPRRGAVSGSRARCHGCGAAFPIARTARGSGAPPAHRLYAKLVLRRDGRKEYLRTTDGDEESYRRAARRLRRLRPPRPAVPIREGNNTSQVLNYGYSSWDQMFNDRQHLALALLASAIRDLPAGAERDALMLLFSGVLEFSNMFASYKGEGTGAVRHMFSHHVLKPERTPIEANVWGTPKSSGSFSTLFQSRLLRALDYKQAPFEVAVDDRTGRLRGRKVFGVSPPMGAAVLDRIPAEGLPAGGVYLSCGDSARTELADRSVDLIATDPPFFDNVHYSELADFFHVWQKIYFDGEDPSPDHTTRRPEEVQHKDARTFASKLERVFGECHRVLRDDGLMVFSYHHSRDDGWLAVAQAVWRAGFRIVAAQPVKAEMSVAKPKARAKSPIDLDVLMVCRKRRNRADTGSGAQVMASALAAAREQIARFNQAGRLLSQNDVRVVLHSQLLVNLSPDTPDRALAALPDLLAASTTPAGVLWRDQDLVATRRVEAGDRQLELVL